MFFLIFGRFFWSCFDFLMFGNEILGILGAKPLCSVVNCGNLKKYFLASKFPIFDGKNWILSEIFLILRGKNRCLGIFFRSWRRKNLSWRKKSRSWRRKIDLWEYFFEVEGEHLGLGTIFLDFGWVRGLENLGFLWNSYGNPMEFLLDENHILKEEILILSEKKSMSGV